VNVPPRENAHVIVRNITATTEWGFVPAVRKGVCGPKAEKLSARVLFRHLFFPAAATLTPCAKLAQFADMSNLHRASVAFLTIVICFIAAFARGEDYKPHPDMTPQEGVPKGTVTRHVFNHSRIYPGSVHNYSVYVPSQYKKEESACVMVFQDGGGGLNVSTVFDNLIHRKEMPVTIAVMISPGIVPPPEGSGALPRFNRSYEYDSPTDLYARFVLDEILPEVGKEYNLTKEATGRAICGASSGGIAAFVAAWERPDSFSRVVSFVGSFADLRGGNNLASLIRKTEPKPIRVFMQDGTHDQEIFAGSWYVGNQAIDRALSFVGYEHQFVVGTEGHNGKHAAAIFPDAVRYIWKDYPALPKLGTFEGKDKRNVMDVLLPGEGWQLVSQGNKGTEGPTADAQGNVYFSEGGANRIHKVTPDGKVSLFVEDPCGADGMMVGPDNKLYVCAPRTNQIVTFDLADPTKKTVIASGMPSVNDLVVTHKGAVYATDYKNKQVFYIPPGGEKKVVDTGLQFPNGLILTPDQTQLIVADMNGPGLYIFSIKEDGTLTNKALYFVCEFPENKSTSGADGVAMDVKGNLYVATHIGIQIFDQAGRVTGIIPSPIPGRRPSNVDFGGPDNAYLYIAEGDKVFRRKTKAKGVLFFENPVLPPKPRL
jgi:sugar lactone lactonase YvrE/enterochelin esterase-like enzyme